MLAAPHYCTTISPPAFQPASSQPSPRYENRNTPRRVNAKPGLPSALSGDLPNDLLSAVEIGLDPPGHPHAWEMCKRTPSSLMLVLSRPASSVHTYPPSSAIIPRQMSAHRDLLACLNFQRNARPLARSTFRVPRNSLRGPERTASCSLNVVIISIHDKRHLQTCCCRGRNRSLVTCLTSKADPAVFTRARIAVNPTPSCTSIGADPSAACSEQPRHCREPSISCSVRSKELRCCEILNGEKK